MTERVFVGLGSNLGNSRKTLTDCLRAFKKSEVVTLLACSGVYRTAPVGVTNQPDFLNMAAELRTSLSPRGLLGFFLEKEQCFGRVRDIKWGPRTLDLDLLLYGSRVESMPGLEVPHPELSNRGFVLGPLSEIAPDFLHPVLGETVKHLYDAWADAEEDSAGKVKRIGDCPLSFRRP